ncbi:MAG: EAL domain-containing protein [Treponema sp.]|nr:EAL domain-containing protein [Treponema sp.]
MTVKKFFLFFVLALFLLVLDFIPLFLFEKYFFLVRVSFPGNVIATVLLLVQLFIGVLITLIYKKKVVLFVYVVFAIHFAIVFSLFIQTKILNLIPVLGIIISELFSVGIIAFLIERNSSINKVLLKFAHTDYLTEAKNIRCMELDLNELVSKKTRFALMLIDLDSFKHINEVRGYRCGNEVLKKLVMRWHKVLENTSNTLYRINGDEFSIIFRNYETKEELKSYIRKVSSSFDKPVLIGTFENYICAYAGIVEYPENSSRVEQLRQFADAALSDAKKKVRGKNKFRYCTFNADTLQNIRRELFISDILQKAVSSSLFSLSFQPQYNAKTKTLHGFECLIRLHDFEGNVISPEEFIPIAEKEGFIYNIGEWVMKNGINAFKSALDNASEIHKNVTLSINISCIQFLDETFIEFCKEIISDSQINVKNLMFEITESVLVKSTEKAVKFIEELNAHGVCTSIDDFGTGYSSLSYIYKFNFKELKIDKSFTDAICSSKKNEDFIKMIISACHRFGLQVVTEGVESEEQYQKLLRDGCDIIQGYYFSRPVDEDKMIELMASL